VTTVIFTCAGQRAEIVRAFSQAGATTIAADAGELAPALYIADVAAKLPLASAPDYIAELQRLILEHEADLVLPLTDLDPELLARERDRLDALVLLPEAEVVARGQDKLSAHEFLTAAGIGSPATWHPDELPADPQFPLFVKLRHGSAAKQVATAHDARQLRVLLELMEEEAIVQELLTGEEYSIDVFCDLDRRCLNAIPRTMIESKGGESIKGMTIGDEELIAFGQQVAETFGVVGPATIQCFRDERGPLVTDINFRFGGAFPLPTAAGSRYPEYALALARGENLEPCVGEFERGVLFSCYPTHVLFKEGEAGLVPLAAETAD
jgi:carbamoyl-phosphate synthase large subunit